MSQCGIKSDRWRVVIVYGKASEVICNSNIWYFLYRAATHTAKSFHKHASMACPVNATNVITEYYLLLNGKCDMVLREKVAPPPPPKVTQGVITNTNTTVGDSQMNGTQTNDTQTNANKTNLPESTRISAKHQALQNRNEEFEKTMKEIENHSFIKHLERTGNDRELKEQLSRVRKIVSCISSYTHRQKLSNTTFFRRHCFGSCRTEYVGNGNKTF